LYFNLNKFELIFRVEDFIKNGKDKHIVDPDPHKIYTRRKEMASKPLSEPSQQIPQRPVKYPENNWTTSLESMPLFTRAEMDLHILKSGKNVVTSVPTNLRKAQTFLDDEYLHEIVTSKDQRYFYFKANCSHSFRKNDAPHSLKVALCVLSGRVEHAYCSCVAGADGYCNHVLALMLKLAKFTLFHCKTTKDLCKDKDETEAVACTSELLKWRLKGGGSHITPQPVSNVQVNKTKPNTSTRSGVKSLLYEARVNLSYNEQNIQQFKKDLSLMNPNMGLSQMALDAPQTELLDTKYGKCPKGSFGSYQLAFTESNFSANADLSAVPRRIEALVNCEEYPRFPHDQEEGMTIPDFLSDDETTFIQSLRKDENEINEIERNTRKQSDCDQWKKERRYRFTASKFHAIKIRQKNFNTLADSIMNPKSLHNVQAINHGKNFEPVALMEYQKFMKNSRTPVKVLASGFVISKSCPILGASPDARVIDPGCIHPFGLAEVKCPHKVANVSPIDACSDPKFCMEKTGTDTCRLKTSHEYYMQVQGQMGVTGCRWCDFIVYTRKGIYIQRIPFDVEFWNSLKEKLTSCYFRNFISFAIEDHETNKNNE